MPHFGFSAKHFNYHEIEDVNYYYVPTPLTELMFKTVFEQGQLFFNRVFKNTLYDRLSQAYAQFANCALKNNDVEVAKNSLKKNKATDRQFL